MINYNKIRWHGFMKTLGSLWSLWVTIFPTHLALSSFKFEHMGNVMLLEGDVVSNRI